jgi:hypothetical protein
MGPSCQRAGGGVSATPRVRRKGFVDVASIVCTGRLPVVPAPATLLLLGVRMASMPGLRRQRAYQV